MRQRIGQAIAPLLIIQRVAKKSALTGHCVVTGHTILFDVGSRGESTGSNGTPSGRYHIGSVDKHGDKSGELGVGLGLRSISVRVV